MRILVEHLIARARAVHVTVAVHEVPVPQHRLEGPRNRGRLEDGLQLRDALIDVVGGVVVGEGLALLVDPFVYLGRHLRRRQDQAAALQELLQLIIGKLGGRSGRGWVEGGGGGVQVVGDGAEARRHGARTPARVGVLENLDNESDLAPGPIRQGLPALPRSSHVAAARRNRSINKVVSPWSVVFAYRRLAARRRARLPARRVPGGVRRAGAGPLLAPRAALLYTDWMRAATTRATPYRLHRTRSPAVAQCARAELPHLRSSQSSARHHLHAAGQPHRRGSRARYSLSLRFHPPTPLHNTSHTSKAPVAMADYVIRNGLIVDGTGSAPCVSTAARCFLRSPAQFARRC